jgi:proteasome lid subunit RPN8/RPN11
VLGDVETWAAAGYPSEVCGLLLGAREGNRWSIDAATLGTNLAVDRRRDRYLLDPAHYLEVDRRARRQGTDVVGAWHSHPDHLAIPSATDHEQAWEGFLYVIVPTGRQGAGTARAWLLDGDGFAEIDKEITR